MTAYLATGMAVICCAFAFGAQSHPSPYLGQPVPGLTPKLFAPGIISTDAVELNSVFTPDLKEFFFSRQVEGRPSLFHSTLVDGKWSAPSELILLACRSVRPFWMRFQFSPSTGPRYSGNAKHSV